MNTTTTTDTSDQCSTPGPRPRKGHAWCKLYTKHILIPLLNSKTTLAAARSPAHRSLTPVSPNTSNPPPSLRSLQRTQHRAMPKPCHGEQTVLAAFGVGGFALVCLYFVFGSAVTKLKLKQKEAEGIAEARSGRRGRALSPLLSFVP